MWPKYEFEMTELDGDTVVNIMDKGARIEEIKASCNGYVSLIVTGEPMLIKAIFSEHGFDDELSTYEI
jgi:hypothetical protein